MAFVVGGEGLGTEEAVSLVHGGLVHAVKLSRKLIRIPFRQLCNIILILALNLLQTLLSLPHHQLPIQLINRIFPQLPYPIQRRLLLNR